MEILKLVFKILGIIGPKVHDYVKKVANGEDVSDDEVRDLIPERYRNEIDAEAKTAWRKDHGLPI